MMDSKYFVQPFANAGDRQAVPDVDPGDGTVNYQKGYEVGYELDPGECIFQGDISNGSGGAGTVLNVTEITQGLLAVGSVIQGGTTPLTPNTKITALGTGTGGVGTYTVNNAQHVASEAMTAIADPNALLLVRAQFNQLLNDVTLSLARLQQFYTPQWIDTTDNDGAPYAYAKYAKVLYTDGKVWVSQINGNTAEPSTDPTKWLPDQQPSDPADTYFASVDGTPVVIGHLPAFSDVNGSLADTGVAAPKLYLSAQQAISNAGSVIGPFNHLLGAAPDEFGAYYICTDAGGDGDYAQGDRIPIYLANALSAGGGIGGTQVWANVTEIGATNAGGMAALLDKTGTGHFSATEAKWRLVLWARLG